MIAQPARQEPLLIRLLRDPAAALAHALARMQTLALMHLALLIAAAATLVALAAARVVWARARQRRLAEGARLLLIGVPPQADAQGGLLLWRALHDLLRPR